MDDLLAAIGDAGVPARCFGVGQADAITDEKGAYLLLMRLEQAAEFELRNSVSVRLERGWLAYAGSARGGGGLRARLRRHFRTEKALHWHVDRLTVYAAEIAALPVPDGNECDLVARLLRSPAFDIAVRGFGNTDCATCDSHLLRFRG